MDSDYNRIFGSSGDGWRKIAYLYISDVVKVLFWMTAVDLDCLIFALSMLRAIGRSDSGFYLLNEARLSEMRAIHFPLNYEPERQERNGLRIIEGPEALHFHKIKKLRAKYRPVKAQGLRDDLVPFHAELVKLEKLWPELFLTTLPKAFTGGGRLFVVDAMHTLGNIINEMNGNGNTESLRENFVHLDETTLIINNLIGGE